MDLTRRGLAPFTLLLVASCAAPAPSAVASAPAGARPSRPAERQLPRIPANAVVLTVEAASTPAGMIVSCCHAFRPGELPPSMRLAGRLLDGSLDLEVQHAVIARHRDGSARICLIDLLVPPGSRDAELFILLQPVSPALRADVDLDLHDRLSVPG